MDVENCEFIKLRNLGIVRSVFSFFLFYSASYFLCCSISGLLQRFFHLDDIYNKVFYSLSFILVNGTFTNLLISSSHDQKNLLNSFLRWLFFHHRETVKMKSEFLLSIRPPFLCVSFFPRLFSLSLYPSVSLSCFFG